MTIKTRFAPSPTGLLHIGGVRTALFSWLYARHHNGVFVLRIEDTDQARSTPEAVNVILEGLKWLGLEYDEGPFYQTQRFDRYQAVIKQLLEQGHAYHCVCSKEHLENIRQAAISRGEKPRYDRQCRDQELSDQNSVIRFKNPLRGEVLVNDKVLGDVVFKNSELDDLIIARLDGTPTYNLTVVVDDMDMGITDVIRGDDHLNNTPRQINILKSLNAPLPNYAHIPMILSADGKKLSKRDGAMNVLQYKDQGYLPAALLNYLVRLGWSHGDQEIFSLDELVALFDLKDVNKSKASINLEKLLWLNQHYLKNTQDPILAKMLVPLFKNRDIDIDDHATLLKVIAVQKQRTKSLVDLVDQSLYFFKAFAKFDEQAAKKHLTLANLPALKSIFIALQGLQDWNNERIKVTIEETTERLQIKFGKLAQPLRVAVTGSSISPSIDDTLYLLGQKRTVDRLGKAIDLIEYKNID